MCRLGFTRIEEAGPRGDRIELDAEGSNDPRWVEYGATAWLEKWFTEPEPPRPPHDGIVAECVGHHLARALGLNPAPGCHRLLDGTKKGWLSQMIRGVSSHWDISRVDSLANYDHLGGMFVLDALIGNEDRHEFNVLFQSPLQGRGTAHTLFCIDHDDAAMGCPARLEELGDEGVPDPARILPGLEVTDGIEQAAAAFAKQASQLDPRFLAEVARDAYSHAPSYISTQQLEQALVSRCARASMISEQYLQILAGGP